MSCPVLTVTTTQQPKPQALQLQPLPMQARQSNQCCLSPTHRGACTTGQHKPRLAGGTARSIRAECRAVGVALQAQECLGAVQKPQQQIVFRSQGATSGDTLAAEALNTSPS